MILCHYCSEFVGKALKAGVITAWPGKEECLLAVSAILADNSNLEHRTTQHDLDAIKFLDRCLERVKLKIGKKKFYKDVKKSKKDFSNMNSRDLLRKDFKQWDIHGNLTIGISSVGLSFKK